MELQFGNHRILSSLPAQGTGLCGFGDYLILHEPPPFYHTARLHRVMKSMIRQAMPTTCACLEATGLRSVPSPLMDVLWSVEATILTCEFGICFLENASINWLDIVQKYIQLLWTLVAIDAHQDQWMEA